MKRVALLTCLLLAAVGCRYAQPAGPSGQDLRVPGPAAGADGAFVTAAGAAPVAGQEEGQATREADVQARRKLAEAISEYVRAAAGDFLAARERADSPLADEFAEQLAGEVSAAVLRRSVSPEVHREEGRVHVLYRVPVVLVNEQIVEAARHGLAAVNPFAEEPEPVAAALDDFLRDRLAERLAVARRTRRPEPEVEVPEPAGPQMPDWLATGGHENYPRDRFMSALGVGADRASAEGAARSELAARAATRLRSLVRTFDAAGTDAALSRNLEAVSAGSIGFGPGELAATRAVRNWHDTVTDTHYALAVLDRQRAAIVYRRRAADAAREARNLMESARQDGQRDRYGAALLHYLDALASAERLVRAQLRGMAVAAPQDRERLAQVASEPLAAEARAALRSLLSTVELTLLKGDRQWVGPGRSLPLPLAVRVTAGQPAVGVPGAPVLLKTPDGRTFGRCSADSTGVARCRVGPPPPTDGGWGSIVATLDLGELAPGLRLTGFEMPQATFQYAVRAKAQAVVGVHVREVAAEGSAELVRRELERAVADAGFELLPRDEVLQHAHAGLPADAPPGEALDLRALGAQIGEDEFLLVVAARLHTREVEVVETEGGALHVVNCDYRVDVIDPAAPQEAQLVLSNRGTSQGAYLEDANEAARRALQDAADRIKRGVVGGLQLKFGLPESQ